MGSYVYRRPPHSSASGLKAIRTFTILYTRTPLELSHIKKTWYCYLELQDGQVGDVDGELCLLVPGGVEPVPGHRARHPLSRVLILENITVSLLSAKNGHIIFFNFLF